MTDDLELDLYDAVDELRDAISELAEATAQRIARRLVRDPALRVGLPEFVARVERTVSSGPVPMDVLEPIFEETVMAVYRRMLSETYRQIRDRVFQKELQRQMRKLDDDLARQPGVAH